MPSVASASTRTHSLLQLARELGHDAARISRHRRVLESHERAAERFLAAGDPAAAIQAITNGSWLAGLAHPGVHASVRMERVIERIGHEHLPASPARERTGVERVLHIATETYQVGGHSRVMWRWIGRDTDRRHDVVLTGQRASMPEGLAAAVRETGGDVTALSAAAPALERAGAVRRLAQEADLVVLHVHPHDPIPAIALADPGGRPPVVFFNHGDHLFWIGASVVDVLHNIRPASFPMAVRRGIAAERCTLLPFPVSGPDGHGRDPSSPVTAQERAEARRRLLDQLRWPEDAVVLVTVGAAYKYDGPEGVTLLELLEPVLREHPRAHLLAVGPADEGAWAEARKATGGRVTALGARTGMGAIFAGADLYVESRPFGGTSASAEAASHGLPVLTHAVSDLEAELFCTAAQYGATTLFGPDAYRQAVGSLIDDDGARAEAGAQARGAVVDADTGWEPGVEAVYRRALEIEPASAGELTAVHGDAGDLDVLIGLIDEIHTGRRSLDAVETIAGWMDYAARSEALRRVMSPGLEVGRGVLRALPAAFAAPPATEEALTVVVAEMRQLRRLGFVDAAVIALRPEDADAAVPVLEAALADGGEFELDLVLDENPAGVRRPGALELVQPGDSAPSGPHLVCEPRWHASLA